MRVASKDCSCVCIVTPSTSALQAVRKISKIPFKVLDAPELQDDFYLNLVDWSSTNVLSVGLGTCVYLWSACTSQVCSVAFDPSISHYSKLSLLRLPAVLTFCLDVQFFCVYPLIALVKVDSLFCCFGVEKKK